jgi:hypothetical protein
MRGNRAPLGTTLRTRHVALKFLVFSNTGSKLRTLMLPYSGMNPSRELQADRFITEGLIPELYCYSRKGYGSV